MSSSFKRISVTACRYCQISHLSCSLERPCKNCIEREFECTIGKKKKMINWTNQVEWEYVTAFDRTLRLVNDKKISIFLSDVYKRFKIVNNSNLDLLENIFDLTVKKLIESSVLYKIPTAIWRVTGEIVYKNEEFDTFINYNFENLFSCQLLNIDHYFQNDFGTFSILHSKTYIKVFFNVKRDFNGNEICILGNFIPDVV